MVANNQPAGFFAITKTKIIVVVSLAITWWIAYLLPHYSPIIKEHFNSRLDDALQKMPNIKVDWKQVEHPRSAYNTSKVAIIVEPRPIPHLTPQILHMIEVIPSDWRMIFIGSPKSIVSVSRAYAIKNQQIIGKLDLMVLPEPWEIDSKEKVSRLFTDMRFYDEFLPGVEWILKFEYDSILCANSETSLNEWLDWSWAGAPRTAEDRFAGNGGLSLRRVSAVKRVLSFQERHNDTQPEDEWFGRSLVILPGEKVASGINGVLAVEDVYIDNPMGYHVRDGGRNNLADDVWKDPARRKKIMEYCPELSLIMEMKLERERCKGDNKMGEINPPEDDPAKKEEANKKKAEEAAKKQAAEKKKAEEEAKKKEADKKAAEEDAKKATASKAEATAQPSAAETLLRASGSASPSPSPTPVKATLQGLD